MDNWLQLSKMVQFPNLFGRIYLDEHDRPNMFGRTCSLKYVQPNKFGNQTILDNRKQLSIKLLNVRDPFEVNYIL